MKLAPEYWIAYGFRGCYVRYFPATCCTETIYPDGTLVPAAPADTESYRGMALSLGYRGNAAACCREHELLHTFLAEAQGLPYSIVLWALAHGTEEAIPLWQRENEESVVLNFQRYLNGADPETLDLPANLLTLRAEALEMLRHHHPIPTETE